MNFLCIYDTAVMENVNLICVQFHYFSDLLNDAIARIICIGYFGILEI